MEKKKVLFVCVHNTARSQMAEAFLKALGGDRFIVESAGLKPGALNPLVVEAMREIGIDVSKNKPQSAFDCFKAGRHYNYVITVCDESNAERCPIFPGFAKRLHWPFADPAQLTGSHEERLQAVRSIRDQIRARIAQWISAEENK